MRKSRQPEDLLVQVLVRVEICFLVVRFDRIALPLQDASKGRDIRISLARLSECRNFKGAPDEYRFLNLGHVDERDCRSHLGLDDHKSVISETAEGFSHRSSAHPQLLGKFRFGDGRAREQVNAANRGCEFVVDAIGHSW